MQKAMDDLGAVSMQLAPSLVGGMLVAVGGRGEDRMAGRDLAAKAIN